MVKSKSNVVFSVFVAVIFLASGLLVFAGGSSGGYGGEYNGFEIGVSSQSFVLNVGDERVLLGYHPINLESINVSGSFEGLVGVDTVSLVSDSSENFSLSTYFVSSVFEDVGKVSLTGFSNSDHGTSLDVVSCSDASEGMVVVIFEESDEEMVIIEGFCVRVLGSSDNVGVFLGHRVIYGLLGVMD